VGSSQYLVSVFLTARYKFHAGKKAVNNIADESVKTSKDKQS
jgi:hypothetical protein